MGWSDKAVHATRRGLSLLEVVMAVTLLTGALFTLGVLIPRSVMHLRNKSFETVATQMAERLFDEARGLDVADIPSGTWDSRSVSSSGGVRTPDKPAHENRPRRQFPPPPYPAAGALPASVSVEQNGQTVSVAYDFLVEVSTTSPGAARTMSVTVFWREPRDGGEVARSWRVVSEIGQ